MENNVLVYDEFDIVNTFPHRERIRSRLKTEPGESFTLIGENDRYHEETRSQAMIRLGLDTDGGISEAIGSESKPSWVKRYPNFG